MNNTIRKMMTVVLLLLGSTPALYAQFNPTNPPEPDAGKPEEVITYYTVTISASPATAATVPSGGKFTTGSSKYVYSTRKNSNYRFSHWTLNGEYYSDKSSFTYTIETFDADFVAHYVFDPSSPTEPERLPEIVCYRLNLATNNDAVCTFNQESGNEYEPGTMVTLEAFVNKGYDFKGWYNGTALISKEKKFVYQMPEEAVTLTAKVSKVVFNPTNPSEPDGEQDDVAVGSYNLTYMVDGQEYKVVNLKFGTEIVPETPPTKEGHTFSGWSEIPAKMPAEDVVVEGSFIVNTYNVIYEVDGVEYKVVPISYGSEITLIEAPAKEGYTFSGWGEAPATMPAEDVTIEGSFTINSYNLIYKVDGEEYKVVHVTYGSEITLIEAPAKEGYTFSGWSEAPATMPAEDITIEGTFTVNNYTVTYIVDGEVYATETVAYGSEITLIEAPAKEGYTFSGWSEAPATMPAEDVVIEGTFAVNHYTVTYIVDGEVYATETVAYGSEITLIQAPTKEGHTFSGWSEAPGSMPAEDVVIEGLFAVNYYTVTYIVDGEVYATETVAYGSEITLIEAPTKEGHTFSGWSEAPGLMPAEDVVIEGLFAVNYYTVTYLVDGEVYATETVAYGSEITLIDEPTKEGHTFSGWSEAPATMPAEDVVVEGYFTPITNINGIYGDLEEQIIYNLKGERIINTDKLERGVYIINGQKVWVK